MVIATEFELTEEEAEAFDIVREVLTDIEYNTSKYDIDLATSASNIRTQINKFLNDKRIHTKGESK